MTNRSIRCSRPSIAAGIRIQGRRPIEPMLPALGRSLIFLCSLATPFVAALLIG